MKKGNLKTPLSEDCIHLAPHKCQQQQQHGSHVQWRPLSPASHTTGTGRYRGRHTHHTAPPDPSQPHQACTGGATHTIQRPLIPATHTRQVQGAPHTPYSVYTTHHLLPAHNSVCLTHAAAKWQCLLPANLCVVKPHPAGTKEK